LNFALRLNASLSLALSPSVIGFFNNALLSSRPNSISNSVCSTVHSTKVNTKDFDLNRRVAKLKNHQTAAAASFKMEKAGKKPNKSGPPSL
jgi:hypothetical protein